MPKFSFYEIKCSKTPKRDNEGNEIENAEPIVVDRVVLQFTKRVNLSNMRGDKGEEFSVDIADLPGLFGFDTKFPAIVGFDATARTSAVKAALDKYLGHSCMLEQIKKGDGKFQRQIISYIEWT